MVQLLKSPAGAGQYFQAMDYNSSFHKKWMPDDFG
jgi:hypothetical protein